MNVPQTLVDTTKSVSQKYPLVDIKDVSQELWVWVATHAHKTESWEDDEHGEAKLRKTLLRVGNRYARREQESRRQLGSARDTGSDY